MNAITKFIGSVLATGLVAGLGSGCAARQDSAADLEDKRIAGTNRSVPRNRVEAGRNTIDRAEVTGRHGGAWIDLGGHFAEVVTTRSGDARLYLYDAAGNRVPTSGKAATLTFDLDFGRRFEVPLESEGTEETARFEGAIGGLDRIALEESGTYGVDLVVVDGGSTLSGRFKNRGAIVTAATVVAVGKDVPLSGNVPGGDRR